MKIGLFLPNLGNNQLATDAIANINSLVISNTDIYPSVFFKEVRQPIIKLRTVATTFDKIYHYDGHLITTNIDTTYIALQCRRLKSITFFLSELEWTKNIGNYISNIYVYQNKSINILSPSKEYAFALYNYCGRQIPIIQNGLNINEIATRIRAAN